MEISFNSAVSTHARLVHTVKIRLASIAHLNVLLVSIMPVLVLHAQMLNTCSKENVSPNVQFHWSLENALIFAQVVISLKSEVETASNVMTNVKLVIVLLINVLHAKQDLPVMVHVSQPAPQTLSILTEIVSPVLKDATVVKILFQNVLPVNQDSSWSQENVLLHAMPVSSEMETTGAKNAQLHAHHAHQPPPVLHVLKPEINQSMVSATAVFTHVLHALHLNNALLV